MTSQGTSHVHAPHFSATETPVLSHRHVCTCACLLAPCCGSIATAFHAHLSQTLMHHYHYLVAPDQRPQNMPCVTCPFQTADPIFDTDLNTNLHVHPLPEVCTYTACQNCSPTFRNFAHTTHTHTTCQREREGRVDAAALDEAPRPQTVSAVAALQHQVAQLLRRSHSSNQKLAV